MKKKEKGQNKENLESKRAPKSSVPDPDPLGSVTFGIPGFVLIGCGSGCGSRSFYSSEHCVSKLIIRNFTDRDTLSQYIVQI
jgi:hypothetical protein